MQSQIRQPSDRTTTANDAGDAPARGAPADCRPPRWVGFVWTGAISLLIAGALSTAPVPALSGEGLLVTAGLLVIGIAGLFELRRGASHEPRGETLLGIGLGFGLIAFTDGGGTALIGALAAVAAAAHSRPLRPALIIAVPIGLLVNAAMVAGDDVGVAGWIGINWGLLSSFVLGVLIRGGRRRHREAAQLLEQARLTRDAQAEAARLTERGRIARELHDVLAHSLSALAVQLQGARLLAVEEQAGEELQGALERAHRQARDGLVEARSAIGALRGESLPGPDGLGELADALGEEQRIDCSYAVEGQPESLPPQHRLALYRIGQEALTNVRKHSEAERVEVLVSYEENGTRLTVEDRRAGAAGDDPVPGDEPGYGIAGMGERAEQLGGRLAALPTEQGFRVELWLPRPGEPARS